MWLSCLRAAVHRAAAARVMGWDAGNDGDDAEIYEVRGGEDVVIRVLTTRATNRHRQEDGVSTRDTLAGVLRPPAADQLQVARP